MALAKCLYSVVHKIVYFAFISFIPRGFEGNILYIHCIEATMFSLTHSFSCNYCLSYYSLQQIEPDCSWSELHLDGSSHSNLAAGPVFLFVVPQESRSLLYYPLSEHRECGNDFCHELSVHKAQGVWKSSSLLDPLTTNDMDAKWII